jgi:hypothetical protein
MSFLAKLAVLLILTIDLAFAVPYQPGQIYAAGTRVNFPINGVSLVIPKNYSGGYHRADRQEFLISDNTNILALTMQTGINQASFLKTYKKPFKAGGISFKRVGQPLVAAKDLTLKYRDATNRYVLLIRVLHGANGNSLIIRALGSAAQEKTYAALINTLKKTVAFSAPRPGDLLKRWNSLLKGKRLWYYQSGGSGNSFWSREEGYDFCPGGAYGYFYESYANGSGGVAKKRDSDSGRWSLQVKGNEGSVATLTTKSDKTGAKTKAVLSFAGTGFDPSLIYVNDTEFTVSAAALCR